MLSINNTSSFNFNKSTFIGIGSARRKYILEEEIVKPLTVANVPVNLHVSCGSWESVLLDEERDFRVQHSRLVLNIHTAEG